MKPINCLVVDDEVLAQNVLLHHIGKFDFLSLRGVCNNVFELISFLNKDKDIDLIFLDIRMPEISGLEFAGLFKHPPAIIFTTAYNEYALDAFDQSAIDYLLKPVSLERFSRAVIKARQFLRQPAGPPVIAAALPEEEGFYVKSDKKLVKVVPGTIFFIEALRNYVSLSTTQGKIMVHSTLSNLEQKLGRYPFMLRVHKSFLVNFNKIQYFENNMIMLTNGQSVPVGLAYREQVMERLKIL